MEKGLLYVIVVGFAWRSPFYFREWKRAYWR